MNAISNGIVLNIAKRLAEQKIHKAIRGSLPGIESELKEYLVQIAEHSDLDVAAEIASIDVSDVIGTLLDNTTVEQSRDGITINIDTRAVVETLESIAAILTEKTVINMDDIVDNFSDSIDTGIIADIVIRNIKSTL